MARLVGARVPASRTNRGRCRGYRRPVLTSVLVLGLGAVIWLAAQGRFPDRGGRSTTVVVPESVDGIGFAEHEAAHGGWLRRLEPQPRETLERAGDRGARL